MWIHKKKYPNIKKKSREILKSVKPKKSSQYFKQIIKFLFRKLNSIEKSVEVDGWCADARWRRLKRLPSILLSDDISSLFCITYTWR